MPLLIAALLGLAALFVVITPLLGLQGAERTATALAAALAAAPEVSEQEQSARQALREVDFDHHLGNLDEADYVALRDRYEDRALEAMKVRYDSARALDALIERALAALRDQERTANGHAPTQRKTATRAVGHATTAAIPATTATPSTPPHRSREGWGERPARQPGLSRRRGGTA